MESSYSNGALIRRLLAVSWRYRAGCIRVFLYQIILLATGLGALGLAGLGIDFVRHELQPGSKPPQWPFHLTPPATWPAMNVLTAIAAAILLLALARTFLNYLYSIAVAELIERYVVVDIRTQVYDKLQRLSFRFFDANASGSIINRVTGDSRAVANFLNQVLIQGVIMLLSLFAYLAYMLFVNVRLTLVCLATTPLLWIISSTFSRIVQPQYTRNRDLVDEMIQTLAESVQGIQTIKGFAREPEQAAKFEVKNQAVREQQQSIFWKVSVFIPSILFLTQVNIFVLLAYGGHLVVTGELPIGTGMVVFAGLLQQFSAQITTFAQIANTAQQSLTGARRVFEVLDAPVEIYSSSGAVHLEHAKGAVRFDHVTFSYNKTDPVLDKVDFEVQPGECVAILGATGAGKSTLLSLIPRFYDATNGRVMVDGMDVREIDLDDLRRHIGLVFQESFLFSNTVAANIAFGHPDATREQIERAATIAAAHEFIRELPQGYDTLLREGGNDLSGGQRQRLAIARAILLDPSILLLDDPTAAVDPQTEQEILHAIDNAMRGRTTFIVAHRMSTLRRAHRVIVLEHGRIAQIGRHEELIARDGHYRYVLSLQLTGDDGGQMIAGNARSVES